MRDITDNQSQAVGYGSSSVKSFALLGSSSLNFGLWGLAIIPAWFVVRRIGIDLSGPVDDDEKEPATPVTEESVEWTEKS